MHKKIRLAFAFLALLAALPSTQAAAAGSNMSDQATQSIPPELARFKQRYEAVMAKKDLAALADMIAPGFLHNGRDGAGMIAYFRTFTPYINSYRMDIKKFVREGDLLIADYDIVTDLASNEFSVPFKTINGELHFYGNQRPLPGGSAAEVSAVK
ncbi:hypothetical protein BH11PSE11_BH11PSE11_07590 [soil metagenome]